MKPPLTVVNATSPRRKQRQTGDDLVQSVLAQYELEAGGVALLRQTGDALIACPTSSRRSKRTV